MAFFSVNTVMCVQGICFLSVPYCPHFEWGFDDLQKVWSDTFLLTCGSGGLAWGGDPTAAWSFSNIDA
jgi:hypothetical protein